MCDYHIFEQQWSQLLLYLKACVACLKSVVSCILESVFMCGSWGCGTWLTEPGGGKRHSTYSRANTQMQACWISPILIISVCSRFLKTNWPTYTNTAKESSSLDRSQLQGFMVWNSDSSLLSVSGILKGKVNHHLHHALCSLNTAALYSLLLRCCGVGQYAASC